MRVPIAILLLACALGLGCGTQPLRPAVRVVDVRLDLALSDTEGSSSRPITITAIARNAGTRTVYHIAGCGCDGIGFEILGPDGRRVAYWDPCRVLPACPCGHEPLPPSGTLPRSMQFAGAVYSLPAPGDSLGPCMPEAAPPGDYVVIARYSFRTDVQGESASRETRAAFHWSDS